MVVIDADGFTTFMNWDTGENAKVKAEFNALNGSLRFWLSDEWVTLEEMGKLGFYTL
jgi:hypothetical protein